MTFDCRSFLLFVVSQTGVLVWLVDEWQSCSYINRFMSYKITFIYSDDPDAPNRSPIHFTNLPGFRMFGDRDGTEILKV